MKKFCIITNLLFLLSGTNAIAQASYFDPVLMTCPPGGQFTLKSGSPAIDQGDWLNYVVSNTGVSASVQVTNAGTFVPGSYLKTQSKVAAIVQSVDRNNNTVTVTQPINWVKGEGVFFKMFYGEKPDIGACEFAGINDLAPSATQNLKVVVWRFFEDSYERAERILKVLPEDAQPELEIKTFRSTLSQCMIGAFNNILGCIDNVGAFIGRVKNRGFGVVYPDVLLDLEALEKELINLHYRLKLKVNPDSDGAPVEDEEDVWI